MITGALAMVALGLTIIAYSLKRTTLALGAAFAWLLFAIQGYANSAVMWDIYYCMFWFGIAMMLGIGIEASAMRIWATFGRNDNEISNNGKKPTRREVSTEYMHPADKLRIKHGLPPSAQRAKRDMDVRTGWR